MKIFLSWSGAKSKKVAEALKTWLPLVINSLEPWFSPEDIQKGSRWTSEIAVSLEKSPVGIFCLTSDNLTAPWILFEAGAISKMSDSLVYTFLLDIKPSTVEQPLGQFNHTVADKRDVFQFLVGVNGKVTEMGERSLSDDQLRESFEMWWPKLEKSLREAQQLTSKHSTPPRSPENLLQEVVDLIRVQDRKITDLGQEIIRLREQRNDEVKVESPPYRIATYTLTPSVTGEFVKVPTVRLPAYAKLREEFWILGQHKLRLWEELTIANGSVGADGKFTEEIMDEIATLGKKIDEVEIKMDKLKTKLKDFHEREGI